jgi:hypothetical protein
MTEYQAAQIVELLKAILRELEEFHSEYSGVDPKNETGE